MPIRFRVPLETQSPASITPQDLHFHVCRWVEGPNREGHSSHLKPFAISPPGEDVDGPFFELGIFDDGLVSPAVERIGAEIGQRLRFGKSYGCIGSGITVLDCATWEELLHRSKPIDLWLVEAHTPLLVRRGNTDIAEPVPSLIVGLSRRWEHFSPLTLEPPSPSSARLARLSTDSVSGDVVRMRLLNRQRQGWVGAVTFKADIACADALKRIDALWHFAEFAGVGSLTPFGFGVVSTYRQHPSTGERGCVQVAHAL